MYSANRPLYPWPGDGCGQCGCRECRDRENWRMPLFGCERRCGCEDRGCPSQVVRLENPCCPGEYAEVELSVDDCGNLVVYVRRNASKCTCRRPKKRC